MNKFKTTIRIEPKSNDKHEYKKLSDRWLELWDRIADDLMLQFSHHDLSANLDEMYVVHNNESGGTLISLIVSSIVGSSFKYTVKTKPNE